MTFSHIVKNWESVLKPVGTYLTSQGGQKKQKDFWSSAAYDLSCFLFVNNERQKQKKERKKPEKFLNLEVSTIILKLLFKKEYNKICFNVDIEVLFVKRNFFQKSSDSW